MNLPTNKLRDLIAVLQTLDPDIDTNVDTITPIMDGKRRLYLANANADTRIQELKDSLDGVNDELEELEANHADLKEKYDDLSYRLDNVKEILVSANNLLA